MSQLVALAERFPSKYIHGNPSGGGTYINHAVITQRLIAVLGAPPDFETVQILRGDVASWTSSKGETYPPLSNVVVGAVCRMTATIDGKRVVTEEVGDCEQPHNWKTDGQRLKDSISDAYKRCAMRIGCGLELWGEKDGYFLHDLLVKNESAPSVS